MSDYSPDIREIYVGELWNNDNRFHSPMVECHLGQVYVNDFVEFDDEILGQVVGKVTKFYQVRSKYNTVES